MKHKELVVKANKWLKNTIGCRVRIEELVAYTLSSETPDVIGWTRGFSVLVECKTSRADFRKDKNKRSRKSHNPALGNWRFYLAPPDIIPIVELPLGWGLYEIYNKRVVHKAGVRYTNASQPPFESCLKSEVAMLVSALSRLTLI